MTALTICVTAFAVLCVVGSAAAQGSRPELEHRLNGLPSAGYAVLVLALIGAAQRDRAGTCIDLAIAAVWFWLWWSRRKKRKRSLRQLGNKAKARLAALARNMPRPSPRLVPQRVPA